MAKRDWKQDAERNADKSWKETITSYHFTYFGLMTDLGSMNGYLMTDGGQIFFP